MLKKKNIWIAASLIATATTAACIPGDDPGERTPQEVDAAQVRQAVTESASEAVDSIIEGLEMVQSSEIFGRYADSLFGSEIETCETIVEPDFGEYESCTYENGPYEPVDFSDWRDDLVDLIEQQILSDENIESETGTAVIYRLDPDLICSENEEYPEDYENCVEDFELLEPRVKAQSFSDSTAELELLVGPEMLPVFTIAFAPAKITASVDLAELKQAYIAAVDLFVEEDEERDEVPERMSGRISASLEKRGDEFISSLAIDEAIDVKMSFFSVKLAAADAFTLTVDTAAEALRAALGLNAIDISTLSELDDPDEVDDPESIELRAVLPALQGTLALFVNQEIAELRGLSFGDGTAILKAEGEDIVSVDLNKDHGRSLDLDLKITDDEIEIAVGPAFDLELALAFYRVQRLAQDVHSYLQDELIKVTLDGDDKPAISIQEEGIEVLRGQLRLSSESIDVDLSVEAGMCLGAVNDEEADEEHDEDEEPLHPFEDLGAVACSA